MKSIKPQRKLLVPSRRSLLFGAGASLFAAPAIARGDLLSLMGVGGGGGGGGGSTTTWNSLDKGTGITLSGGNLVATGSASNSVVRAVASRSSGKFYYEFTVTNWAANEFDVGIANGTFSLSATDMWSTAAACSLRVADSLYFNGSTISGFMGGSTGTIAGVAFDLTAKLAWVTLNGSSWSNSGNPGSGTGGGSISGITGTSWFPACCLTHATTFNVLTANFGGSAYSYTPPSGFGNW